MHRDRIAIGIHHQTWRKQFPAMGPWTLPITLQPPQRETARRHLALSVRPVHPLVTICETHKFSISEILELSIFLTLSDRNFMHDISPKKYRCHLIVIVAISLIVYLVPGLMTKVWEK